MIHGWHFENGDYHYDVGAKSEEEARKLVERHDIQAAKAPAKVIPEGVVTFVGLKDGVVVFSKVYQRFTW
jgi:hypothetical protein